MGNLITALPEPLRDLMKRKPLMKEWKDHESVDYKCSRCEDTGWYSVKKTDGKIGSDLHSCPCADVGLRESRIKASGIPEERLDETLDSYKTSVHPSAKLAHQAVTDWVNKDYPAWVVLSGVKGCGKTHLARGSALAVIDNGKAVQYKTSFEISSSFFNRSGSLMERVNQLAGYEFLIIDDLFQEHVTNFPLSAYEDLLNKRYDAKRKTLLTTNLYLSHISKDISGRLASRMSDKSICQWIAMDKMPDYRQTKS